MDFEHDLRLIDDTGRIVLQVAFLATVYFEQGHSFAKRQAVASCFAEYRTIVEGKLRWAHPGAGGRVEPITTPTPDPAVWLIDSSFHENKGWEFYWHGGNSKEEASPFMISGLGSRKWESEKFGALSFLTFALPISLFAEDVDKIVGLFLKFCTEITPLHGYAGFGLVQSPNRFLRQKHSEAGQCWAMRYSGLQIDYPLVHSLFLKDGIKGADWLTVLGSRWIETLGGLELFQTKLPPHASLYPYRGGAMIMSSAHPQLGDTTLSSYPKHYSSIAQLLNPIRVKSHAAVDGFTKEEFEEWLGRLDFPR